jgi:putative DNA primase/helicase
MFHGVTASGKSTLLSVLRRILGPYALALPENYFLATTNSADYVTAALAGVRLATCSETNEGRMLDVAKIKALTGEDTITAALKYQNYFQFQPEVKLLLATNHPPRIPATDDSIWRRVKVVPFNVTVPEEKRIADLAEMLVREEGPGILRWAVLGYRELRSNGLGEPDAVKDAVASYRKAEDVVGNFVLECCVRDNESKTLRRGLYKAYSEWAKESGLRPMSSKRLASELHRLGIHGDAGDRFWFGVRLAEDAVA